MDAWRGDDTGGIRRFLEEERENIIETLRVIRPDAESFLEGAFGQRRQKAILSSIPRIETETRHFGLHSAVETFAGMELKPFNNYNWIDEDGDLTLGAALWILGTLRAAGKLGEAYRLLPDDWGDMDECCLPTDFHHPCFEDDLIRSVMVLITGRYAEPGVITKDNATGSAASDEWEELLKLLPEETVRKACDAFRDKLWDLILRRLRGLAFYELEEKRIISMQDPGMAGPVRRMPERETGEKHAEILRERFDLEEKKTAYELHFDDYLQMDRRTLRRETGSLNIPDILQGFTVEDPFELCFALFYLVDHGDDAPWLMHTGSSLMEYCRKMLPWYEDKADWDDDRWEAWLEGMQYNQSGWLEREKEPEAIDWLHEKHNGKNLAQIVYGLSRGVVPIGLHPFTSERDQLIAEGMQEGTARRITDMAEMLFLQGFRAGQFRFTPWDAAEGDDEEEVKQEEETQADAPVRLGGYWGKIAAAQGVELEKPKDSSAYAEEISDLKEELSLARKQIKDLQGRLAQEKRSADHERAKAERELKSLRMEHRELADLRTLVFNRENEVRETPERGYAYPYETRKRTIVFGGHDTFLKALKPMLPGVRFVDAENMTFSPELIRNAEVIWVQTNCISHPQYWNIVKQCKLSGVQLRYFGFASAEKCAEQLVEWDQK